MYLTIPHGKPPLKLHWVGAIPRSYPYFSQGKMKGSQKSQHPIRAVATVRRSSHGTLLCELGPLMESWVRWSQSGNGEALSSCQQQNCLKARWGHSSAKLAVPHPSLAGTTPVSPDSPANVIISDKRLIGRCTMPFPLIKEHLGKTRIATKHCQQSNQQQQLAVSSPSWAEPCAGSRACGFPHHQDSRGQGQQCPASSGEGGTRSFSACVLCFRGNRGAPYAESYWELPSSWTPQEVTRAVHFPESPFFSAWNSSTHSLIYTGSLSSSLLWELHDFNTSDFSLFSAHITRLPCMRQSH